jgi:hypothetical protein
VAAEATGTGAVGGEEVRSGVAEIGSGLLHTIFFWGGETTYTLKLCNP